MIKTELADVIHLYLGCEKSKVETKDFRIVLRPLEDITTKELINLVKLRTYNGKELVSPRKFKHVLGSYHFEDWTPCNNGSTFNSVHELSFEELNPLQTIYLLKRHFDLFGLIENGYAIDKTTIEDSVSK